MTSHGTLPSTAPRRVIAVRGAAEHNLRRLDVDVPHRQLTVVTGVSGSGKSSLVFDAICRESQRRYVETFSTYARQFLGRYARPAVERIDGLLPAVAIDQRAVVRSPRSTVGTLGELWDWLRLLFARAGRPPAGAGPVFPAITRHLFSFNSPRGACPACRGLGVEDRLDPGLLIADPSRSLRDGALVITLPSGYTIYSQVTIEVLDQVCRAHGFSVDVPWRELTAGQRDVVLNGSDRIRIPYGKHPLSSRLRWKGITPKPREEGVYRGILPVMEQILRQKRNRNILRFVRTMPCRVCGGTRLGAAARAVTIEGRTITDLAAFEVHDLAAWIRELMHTGAAGAAGTVIGQEIVRRAALLSELGLGYLTLDRASASLSGGEAQRIRLAAQSGIGLRNLLYVLDEPSAGLHDRDARSLVGLLGRLRDTGNTVLVVEHDEETIRSADWIVETGPGAGRDGGRLIYSGPRAAFLAPQQDAAAGGPVAPAVSPTREWLLGRSAILARRRRPGRGPLSIRGANRNNLKSIDVDFQLGAFNVITGVSGAGKSSLVEELISRHRDGRLQAAESPGALVEVDQSPIGRTPRSNPATYTGLFDHVRDLFAALPEARTRGLEKSHFSFNVAGGRCEACEGAGVIDVGMHFLGSVEVPCESCGGRRFHADTLSVLYEGLTIHDVLELTVGEAARLFARHPRMARILAALDDLGLGYLTIGQPSTTLSGGEAQRVKLAAGLWRAAAAPTLYVLDEPTSGLHATDVMRLVAALDRLVDQGHTVIVVEHHLDLVAAADWVVDLGPGSGRAGGALVVSGTPSEVAASRRSHTGVALRARAARPAGRVAPANRRASSESTPAGAVPDEPPIRFTGVTTHNLKGIDIEVPAGRLVAVTGVSGSGKSSFAFDTLFAEGRNRFLESFPAYVRRFGIVSGDAGFESVSGLTPVVAIGQEALAHNPRSTVGTLTGVDDFYRLLFSRIGVPHCPLCGSPLAEGRCAGCGVQARSRLTASMFSPNTETGACPSCKGLGFAVECDPDRLVTDPDRPLGGGAMAGHRPGCFYGDPHGRHMATLEAVGRALGIDFTPPFGDLDDVARRVALDGTGSDRVYQVEWRYQRGPRSGVHRFQSAWAGFRHLVREEYERKHADHRAGALEPLMRAVRCVVCAGDRLGADARAVTVAGMGFAALGRLTVNQALDWFGPLVASAGAGALAAADAPVAREVGREVIDRLRRLAAAGLGYLSMDRQASTLSAGEAQRVRLAAGIGSGLTGLTCVFDEPTVGLHARDTGRLIDLLRQLRDRGNTVVVVEHDLDVVRSVDHVIDFGPGAGIEGGRIVAEGSVAVVASVSESVTGRHLRDRAAIPVPPRRRSLSPGVSLGGITRHNLRDVDVEIPRGGLVALTGVSGSGKSTLAFEVLAPSVEAAIGARPSAAPGAGVFCRGCRVDPALTRVVYADGPVGRGSLASTPATMTGLFDPLRDRFAASPDARAAGLARRHFSTSAGGGRCEACEGLGQVRISLDFMPDLWVPCDECRGARFTPAVLACRWQGLSIAECLSMRVRDARRAFQGDRPLEVPLAALDDLGLGYLTLGQPTSTLSGGERQRLALAIELMKPAAGACLYLFDEPTTGLHPEDVRHLLGVFDRLVGAGHTLLVVEHNLDVIKSADWIVDLGPEGGPGGGTVVATGTPEEVAMSHRSHTGHALRHVLSSPGR